MDNNITISAFTLFDVLALCSVIACIASAAMRGVMAEVLAFGGWLLSLTVARSLCNIIAEKAFSNLQPHEMAVVISFVLIFVSMRILLHFLHYCLDYFIKIANLSRLNRVFGGLIGLLKGLLIVSLTVLVCSFTTLPESESWQIAKTSKFFERMAKLLAPTLPDFLREQVIFPPRIGDVYESITNENSKNDNHSAPNKKKNKRNLPEPTSIEPTELRYY